ncbi:MAG TPA: hypothetical protein VNX65_00375 [Patescibacteria group bacterium]|jgi:hypothetical protein|nr:hypothetical protein [Patescibacteria group bacterium]
MSNSTTLTASSTDPTIQALMDQTNAIANDDPQLEAKLQAIAEAVAAAQKKTRKPSETNLFNSIPTDPQDDFLCDSCQ